MNTANKKKTIIIKIYLYLYKQKKAKQTKKLWEYKTGRLFFKRSLRKFFFKT